MASQAAKKIAESIVTKAIIPSIGIALTKAGATSDEKRKTIANLTKLFTDQLSVALDLALEAGKKGTVSSGGVLKAALKKAGSTSAFWGSDTADCIANIGLFALSVGETGFAALADAESFGAFTGVVIVDALKIFGDYYAMEQACAAPYARAKEEINDRINTFGAEFVYQFNQWILSNGGVAIPN